ncbi:NAD-dependent dehydratase [Alkalilimnicola ehrlichii]|uniref:UDP-glucuronate decarboxylase n=1 Tax=Alkalilimnicola ehrlichii TaxID=351052 RepID=A0A3E0WIG2_9GAMM|nr:NAD-dependent dehydratase [Alkalilimnicola ehrlichii]
MTILLTGAAGFVGSHVVDRLLAEGHRVIGVDNLSTGNLDNLRHLYRHPRFEFIEHDVCEPLMLKRSLDWVMHFASPASPPKYLERPVETMLVNSRGTYQLLELAKGRGAAFFLASTSEVYGDPLEHPQREAYWGNVNPIGPRAVYDESKRFAESLVMAYHRALGMPVRIIRIFNTYGPRMDLYDGRVVTNFIRQALTGKPLTIYGNGNQTRSLQYVDDLVEGIVRYLGVDHSGPINLGNPEEFSVLAIAEQVKLATGTAAEICFCPLPENDPLRRKPDISLAQQLLGWRPQVTFDTGLGLTVEQARLRLASLDERLRAAQG